MFVLGEATISIHDEGDVLGYVSLLHDVQR